VTAWILVGFVLLVPFAGIFLAWLENWDDNRTD
jgi:hypothetical protein